MPDLESLADRVVLGLFEVLCRFGQHWDFLVFREFQCGCLNPSRCSTKRFLQEFIRELSHGNLAVFGLMVEDRD